jgi:NitT/TauT family transport system ATP-binding protein
MSGMPLHRSPDVQRIDVRGLSKTFQLAGAAIEAVRDVSFSIRRGEFVALLGPSGSGKSTILNMIATLIKPSSGQILVDGIPVVAGKTTPNVGYVFQRDTLFPWRTVADNIGYGLQLADVRKPSASSVLPPAWRKPACRVSSTPIRRRCRAECVSALP